MSRAGLRGVDRSPLAIRGMEGGGQERCQSSSGSKPLHTRLQASTIREKPGGFSLLLAVKQANLSSRGVHGGGWLNAPCISQRHWRGRTTFIGISQVPGGVTVLTPCELLGVGGSLSASV